MGGAVLEKESCFHCGDRIKADPVRFEAHAFCCEGCRSVYELLSGSGMCTYYEIDRPRTGNGTRPQAAGRFDFLDQPDVKARFVLFSDGGREHVEFHVPQMHCVSCIWLLENLSRLNTGILQSRVDFPRRKVTISYRTGDVRLSEVVHLMARIGYEPELRMEHLSGRKKGEGQDPLGLKIGLAGFAFGNIMLFSLPEYFSPAQVPGSLVSIFEGLNIVISLPVLFYSASGFFRNALTGLKHRQVNMDLPISLGILALYGRSLYEVLANVGPGYFDSFAALIFFLLIGRLVQRRSFNALSFDRDYASFFPISVTRIGRDSGHAETVVPITGIEVGDTLRLRHQELIPADSVLLSDECQVDYSFVTGEADLVTRVKGDLIYAGGRLSGRQADMVVSKPVSQSYLTSLWNNPVFTKSASKGDFSQWTTGIAGYFTLAVMVIAGVATAYWAPVDAGIATHVFISVLIIACPCALAMSAPFTLGASLNVLSSNGFFLKNANVLERLASIRHVVFDKTGTITELRRDEVEQAGDFADDREREAFARVIAQSTHPLARSIAASLQVVPGAVTAFKEEEGRGVSGQSNGFQVTAGSRGFLTSLGIDIPERERAQVYAAVNGTYRAGFTLRGRVRDGLKSSVDRLKKLGLKLHVISGDSARDEALMAALFGADAPLQFEKKPHEKLESLTLLRLSGPVAMVGDGLNDAGALKGSDVGIAVTDDIKSFTPASDAILASASLTKLPEFAAFARSARTIVWASFGISFFYNAIGLSFAVTGTLSPLVSAILMPVSSLSVIGFTSLASLYSGWRKGLWTWKF